MLGTDLHPDYFDNPYRFKQDLTETDQSLAREQLRYVPQFDLRKGIDAYHGSGELGT